MGVTQEIIKANGKTFKQWDDFVAYCKENNFRISRGEVLKRAGKPTVHLFYLVSI